ncbi:hypothetical protein ACPCSB_05710 [Streptomyces pseudogriseolus]|uniref:hypothetical protein n=1 Tax=Streptomyces pseudogriseolus TaxID=36817 RepID=UPI003FA2973D
MPALTMKRCSLGVVALAVTLTACGGNDTEVPAQGNDKASAAAQPSPSPSATARRGGRPVVELPSDVTYTFDWANTGDPAKDAVLADTEQRIKAVDMAIAEQNPLHTTGVTRFYDADVTVDKDGTAALVYCEDQGKAYNKFLETGQVDVTPVSKDSCVVYAAALRKNENGVWVTERLSSQRGSARCRP